MENDYANVKSKIDMRSQKSKKKQTEQGSENKESDIEEREKKDMIKVLTIPFIIKQLYPEMPLDKYEKLRTDIKFLN